MKKKFNFYFLKILFFSALVCLSSNLIKHNPPLIIIANTGLFLAYSCLFKGVIKPLTSLAILVFLALMPIFAYNYLYFPCYLAEAVFLILVSILIRSAKKPLLYLFLFLLVIFAYLYFNLFANHLLRWPAKLETESLIYPQHQYQLEIDRQQKESLSLPYQLRFLIFNEKTAYGYVFLSNVFSFLSLENLYRTVLLGNVFLVLLGFYHLKKLEPVLRSLAIITFFICLLVVGLIKTPDSMRPFSSARGMLLLLALNGFNQKINWKIYLSVLGLSLLVNIA